MLKIVLTFVLIANAFSASVISNLNKQDVEISDNGLFDNERLLKEETYPTHLRGSDLVRDNILNIL